MVITVLKVQNTSLNHTLHFQIWLLLASLFRQAKKKSVLAHPTQIRFQISSLNSKISHKTQIHSSICGLKSDFDLTVQTQCGKYKKKSASVILY